MIEHISLCEQYGKYIFLPPFEHNGCFEIMGVAADDSPAILD